MKKSVTLILAIVVLALLIIALKFMPKMGTQDQVIQANPTTASAEEEKIEVVTIKTEDLDTVTIFDGTNDISYLPPSTEGGDWVIKGHDAFKANAQTLNYRLNQTINVTARQKITPTSLSEYGLEHPTKTVTYQFKDGSIRKLFIGNSTIDNINVYALMEDDPNNVYVISKAFDNCIIADLSTFSDATLSDFNADDYAVLSMNFSGRDFAPIDIHLGEKQNSILVSYEFTSGEYVNIPASNGATEGIKAAFPSFKKIENYVASGVTDLSQYGLDDPSFHMVINYSVQDEKKEEDEPTTTSVETLDLTFGNTLEDAQVAFIVGDDTSSVYSMDGSFINKIKDLITPFALANKFVAMPKISDVKSIDIHFLETEESYHLDIDEANKTYSCNNVNVEMSDFKILYRTVIGITGDKQIEEANSDKTPLITFTYTFNDGSTLEASFNASTSNQFYETILYDKLVVGCSKQQFVKLQENLERALKGEKIPNIL